MRILITGGTGFVGRYLSRGLAARGHEVTILTRSLDKAGEVGDRCRLVEGDSTRAGSWQNEIAKHDAVINLAGAPIFKRWNSRYKLAIVDSRVRTTANVVDAVEAAAGRRIDILSASAVGYYGFHGDEVIDEKGDAGDDFLARVASRWEEEARKAAARKAAARKAMAHEARVVLCRFGIVLGRNGGALAEMIRNFERRPVSVLGSGKQWFSWIHIEDLLRVFLYLIDHREVTGPVNCVSPGPVRNRELTQSIAAMMGKKVSRIPVPGFALRLAIGEFASVLLNGQRVRPSKLLDMGFDFEFPDLDSALADLMGSKDA
jgi:uncharacterized protein (TIGR01777 family)